MSTLSPAPTPTNHNPYVLVIGATGKVGAAISRSLVALHPTIHIHVAGRSAERGNALCAELGAARSTFVKVDVTKYDTLVAAMVMGNKGGEGGEKEMGGKGKCELVVNCAGPFQENAEASVLKAAIETRTPYLDVCDDAAFGKVCKVLHKSALDAGVPCVTTGGLFPGLSNVIAKELIEEVGGNEKCKTVEFDYWVAGTGGLGTTVLTTSFMILRIPATNYRHGISYTTMPMSHTGSRVCTFPAPIGPRRTYLFDLPEVHSIRSTCGIPTVEARFATAPDFFNDNMRILGQMYGEQLKNRELVEWIVKWQEPAIRMVDWFVGEGVGMAIKATVKDAPPLEREGEEGGGGSPSSTTGSETTTLAHPEGGAKTSTDLPPTLSATYYHPSCVKSIGHAVAVMALCMTPVGAQCATVCAAGGIGGARVKPGVWYPEEMFETSKERKEFVRWATDGALYGMGMEWW
ncbi:hypothetical protein M427DRAFT_69517 [Gonapodya prolifera JEL478]|uniref:Saccharopine dehydrogenase NADP binding domain-containing protein n=1 Tax=Gonapodya prolifera (strain JEL478) TaxID=1344416 RepID=A0A139AIE6_GONPJ|nr:hypothetical protein M427DRAFT_69517 [Gonapodya prolifera JEL478]|eukprot:KXS16195.1 hypothetical protein M427DRAFT_69517 [Gonapodya prolifera JEL478]